MGVTGVKQADSSSPRLTEFSPHFPDQPRLSACLPLIHLAFASSRGRHGGRCYSSGRGRHGWHWRGSRGSCNHHNFLSDNLFDNYLRSEGCLSYFNPSLYGGLNIGFGRAATTSAASSNPSNSTTVCLILVSITPPLRAV